MVVSCEMADHEVIAIAEPNQGLGNRRYRRWLPDTTIGLVAAGLALLLPILTLRTAFAPAWTPRYALLGLEAAIGLPLVFALLRTRHRLPVLAALAFVVVSTVSTLMSDNPAMSLFGMEFWGSGLLFVFAVVGMWAVGASSGSRGARSIESAILVGVAVNCAIVFVEVFVDLSRLGVLTVSGQPAGLLGQPVALGAFLGAALWLVGVRAVGGGRTWLVAVAAITACVELSAERLPLVLAPLVVVLLLRRAGWRRVAAVGAAAALGVTLGWGLVGIGAATPSASARLAEPGGGAGRVENYGTAVRAMIDRPILGWGPGRYQAATSQYRTRALEAAVPDGLYADAHNTFLQYGVTTGVVGLAFFSAWLLLAFRRATGPLAGFAALIMIVQLVQPQDVGLTPLAFLALGAAAYVEAPRHAIPTALQVALVGAGVAFAGLVLVGGYREWRAYQGSHADALAVADMLPHWPDRALLAEAATMSSTDGSAVDRVAAARQWTSRAIERDPRDVKSYAHAGVLDIVAADAPTARRHLDEALRLSPWSPNALIDLAALEQQQGNKDAAIVALRKVLEVAPKDALARKLLAALTGEPAPP